MIRHITGTIVEAGPAQVVVDVNGIGYLIAVSVRTPFLLGETCSLFTHLAVRETALDLYGFSTSEELSFFELLLTLPKIGPKSAMQILSQADLPLLRNAILSQDPRHLSKMSGISPKTAEKIVLGLKDALDSSLEAVAAEFAMPSLAGDVIDALITLGYPQQKARETVQQLMAQRPDLVHANDAVKEALKLLSY